jgi:hypothetical protein
MSNTKISRSYVIPFGISVSQTGKNQVVFFLQRKDHLLPNLWNEIEGNDYSDLLMPIGGAVEPGETAENAVMRELEEEVPGWFSQARIPASSKNFCGVNPLKENVVFDGLHVTFVPVDTGVMSSRLYCQSTREGVPAILTLDRIENTRDSDWVHKGYRQACISLGKKIKTF